MAQPLGYYNNSTLAVILGRYTWLSWGRLDSSSFFGNVTGVNRHALLCVNSWKWNSYFLPVKKLPTHCQCKRAQTYPGGILVFLPVMLSLLIRSSVQKLAERHMCAESYFLLELLTCTGTIDNTLCVSDPSVLAGLDRHLCAIQVLSLDVLINPMLSCVTGLDTVCSI